jgi:hypothetical protein
MFNGVAKGQQNKYPERYLTFSTSSCGMTMMAIRPDISGRYSLSETYSHLALGLG